LLKKYKKNVQLVEEAVVKPLTKTQIKKQLKEYLDKHIVKLSVQELLQNPENNLENILESMDSFLKQNIILKYTYTSFKSFDFLDDLSMKNYKKMHFKLLI